VRELPLIDLVAPIRAAGGVVRSDGLVAVVHRPRYDDWTLPKGKALPGETDEECARREVAEETGLRCDVGRLLGTSSYRDRNGRPKTVAYFELTPVEGSFAPNDEVDELRWLAPDEAAGLLTHERERELVRALGA
jgi:8-oxo-dGTP pyrophosphatase MutT (NUDIX family)